MLQSVILFYVYFLKHKFFNDVCMLTCQIIGRQTFKNSEIRKYILKFNENFL